jgi:hypothetical protein
MLHERLAQCVGVLVLRHEEHPHTKISAIIDSLRQAGHLIGKETGRKLNQDTGAVAGLCVSGNRAAVRQIAHRPDCLLDNLVPFFTGDARHEAGSAGIVLEAGVI